MDLSAYAAMNITLVMLAFARIGTALIIMPGFGDTRVPAKLKVGFGLLLSLVMFQAIPSPKLPETAGVFWILMGLEVLVGAFIGLGGRIFMSAFHIMGAQIGYAAGLSNAFAAPDANYDGANMVASLLQTTALALIFATNIHHIMIMGLMHSYMLIPQGQPIMADLVEQLARLGAGAFYIAASIGAPFIIFALLMNLALGLANKVMPAMQVFFVAGPALIISGLILLSLLAASIHTGLLSQMADWYMELVR